MAEKAEPPSQEIADMRTRMDGLADPVSPALANAKERAV